MKAVVFDSDGVLVDSMPSHYMAWKVAFKEICSIEVAKRSIYLLEGMRGIELVKRIFELEKYHSNSDDHMQKLAQQVSQRKNEVFREVLLSSPPKAYRGVKHFVMNLDYCKKAVVSGSARKDVITLLETSLGNKNIFDAIITADDCEKGKPDPSAFMFALDKIRVGHSEALVVENAPLGVEAANKGGIQCIVVLNNSPLDIQDFKFAIDSDRIFKETRSATRFIEKWGKENTK